jgi:hypothetical protein
LLKVESFCLIVWIFSTCIWTLQGFTKRSSFSICLLQTILGCNTAAIMFFNGKRVFTKVVKKWALLKQITILVTDIKRSRLDSSMQENFIFICKKSIVATYGKHQHFFTSLDDLRAHLYPLKRKIIYLPPSDAAFERHAKCVCPQLGIVFFFTSKPRKVAVSRAL